MVRGSDLLNLFPVKQATSQIYKEASPRFWYTLLAFVCFFAYFNTVFNDYGLDDHLVTNHNPQIEKGLSGLRELFTTNYINEDGQHLDYRPLVKASYALEYSLFGWNPHISHLINVLLWALGCCLILSVLLRAFGKDNFSLLFLGMVLYALHPVHTEVVSSLKSRDELFVLIFVFLSASFFLKYTDTGSVKHFALGLLFFLGALLSKISCLPFLASIPLLMWINRQEIKPAAMAFGALLVLILIFYVTAISLLPGFARSFEYVEMPTKYINDYSVVLGTAFTSLFWYLRLLVLPHPLSFYYGVNYVALTPILAFIPLLSLAIHIGVLLGAIYFFKRNRLVSFFLLFYLIQISMYSNIVFPLVGVVAERALLYASLSFSVLTAAGLHYLFNRTQGAGKKAAGKKQAPAYAVQLSYVHVAVLGLLALGYTAATIHRNSEWKDTITLFEADMPHLESSAKANYMMAKELRRLYRTDATLTKEKLETESARAAHYYNLAISAYPNYAQAMEELGMLYAVEQNNASMAQPLFEKAWSIDSTLWRSAYNIGLSYQLMKQDDRAIIWYERALKVKPDYDKALMELGKLYYLKGEKQKALACNDTLAKYYPLLPLPYDNYAVYYLMEKDTTKAVSYFEQGIAHGDQQKFTYLFLFDYYLNKKDTANAVRVRNLAPKSMKGR